MFCSVRIPDSNMSHECLHFCQRFRKVLVSHGSKSWHKRPSLPQNFQESLKQYLDLALFGVIQWIGCVSFVFFFKQNKTKQKTKPKLTLYTDSHFYKNTTQEELKKIRWKGLPPIVFLTQKSKVFLEVSRYFIYIYIIYIYYLYH